jgi:hypothetical protein
MVAAAGCPRVISTQSLALISATQPGLELLILSSSLSHQTKRTKAENTRSVTSFFLPTGFVSRFFDYHASSSFSDTHQSLAFEDFDPSRPRPLRNEKKNISPLTPRQSLNTSNHLRD